jgi:hypothetical protein
MWSRRLRQRLCRVVVTFTTVSLVAVASTNACPILPSPLVIELSNQLQQGNPGDVLTFSGVLINRTADPLLIEGWGISTFGGNTSEFPVDFSFAPEWFALPKNHAFGAFESTPLMPLFTAAIAADFVGSRAILGKFAVAAYPIGAIFRRPDGLLLWENASASITIEIEEPPFLEPIPEPATFVLTTLGGLAMMYRRRRDRHFNRAC